MENFIEDEMDNGFLSLEKNKLISKRFYSVVPIKNNIYELTEDIKSLKLTIV